MEILMVWALLGVVGLLIAERKGHPIVGLILGIALGPIGWLLCAVMPPAKKEDLK